MIKKHRALSLGATAIAVLFLSGAAAVAQDKTVVFWNNWDGSRAEQLRTVLDSFEAAHPGIKVENVTLTSSTTTQRMLAAVASGEVPDLYMTGSNDVSQWASLGALMPLDDYVARDNLDLDGIFYASSIEGSRYNGDLIQLPFKIPTSLAVWYNRSLFTEAGLDPDNPPKTWQELEAAAMALTKREGDVITQHGFNVCINCTTAAENAFNEWLSRNGGNLLTADAKDVAFDNERGIETLRWMVDFSNRTSGSWSNAVEQYGSTFAEVRPSFYAGKVAMIMDGPFLYNIMKAEAPDMLDDIGVFVAPINGANPDAKQRYLGYGVPGYGIPTGAKAPDEAWELLKFIAGEMDGACAFFQMQARPDSPLRDCAADIPERLVAPLAENVNLVEAAVSPPGFPEVHKRIQQMQESALLGNETPEDAIASAAADIRAMLQMQQ